MERRRTFQKVQIGRRQEYDGRSILGVYEERRMREYPRYE